MKLSVYILSAIAILMMAGSLFPQHITPEEYAAGGAGGILMLLTRVFSLLDFYTSPLFLASSIVLTVNLIVCAYDRYVYVVGPKADPARPVKFATDHSMLLTQGMAEAKGAVKTVLTKELRFKTTSKSTGWVVMERGLPCKLLTWLYHIGIVVCCVAVALTYLLAYEGTVRLWPGAVDTLSPESNGRLQTLLGRSPVESKWSIVLGELNSEYTHSPTLDFPDDKRTRLAIGLGWKAPGYSLEKGSIVLKGRRASLRIIKDNQTVVEHIIAVNDPLKYGGYTFYQGPLLQSLKVRLDGGPIPLETETGAELFIPGLKTPVKFSGITAGRLHLIDMSVEEIEPFTMVSRADSADGRGLKLGRLSFNGSIRIDGRRLTMAGFTEGLVIKYRYDPGLLPLWWGGSIVLIAMLARFYGAWYMAAYSFTEENGIVRVNLHVSTVGLRANKTKLIKSFERALKRDDIMPTPLI